ncbi:MAG: FHA domain-containing protein [Fimbriimonadaceae bacterium]|nr:FHA domain-containing protein [Chthonomonadaceae bacterium]MCO5296090.1 FHA domain-containing protein [Fimbriimonadaceae bacterium]
MNDESGKTQSLASDPNRTQLGAPPSADPNRTMMGTAPTLNATQTIKPIQCPVCKTFNPAGVMFCVECGLIFDKALPDDAFGAPAVQLPVLVDSSGREHPLRPGTNVLGREGDVLVADARASRRHAQVSSEEGVLTIEDLGSTNGTLVNGEKLEPGSSRKLENGDKLSLGGVELVLSQPGQATATAAIPSNKTAAIPSAPTVATSVAKLVGDGVEYPLHEGVNTFGRKSENDVAITDPYVSGRHGTIEIAEDGLFVTDTGSTNGTMLNDAKLTANMRTAITEDDVIRLGSLEFKVRRQP